MDSYIVKHCCWSFLIGYFCCTTFVHISHDVTWWKSSWHHLMIKLRALMIQCVTWCILYWYGTVYNDRMMYIIIIMILVLQSISTIYMYINDNPSCCWLCYYRYDIIHAILSGVFVMFVLLMNPFITLSACLLQLFIVLIIGIKISRIKFHVFSMTTISIWL